jgi:hypothetical protein
MMRSAIFALLLSGATAGRSDEADADAGANPIRKVVTLLQDMQKELEAEGAKDKELYDKFMCFCSSGKEELQKTAADSRSQAATLKSQLEEGTAEKAGLEGDLVKHKSDRVAAQQDLDKATALRGKESAEYDVDLADQETNYKAISGAIPALEKGMGASSLIQATGNDKTKLKKILEASQVVSSMEKSDVMAFLEGSQSYAPASGQIVGILKNMKDEMEKSIASLKASEVDAATGYADLKAAKEKEIEAASEAVEVKTKRVGELAVSNVQAEDGADDALAEAADAEKFLATMDKQCADKKTEYAEASKMRAEEVSAISEAINILNDDDALDVFKKAVPEMLLQRSAHGARKMGFLQANKAPSDRLAKAEAMISDLARSSHLTKLNLLSYAMKTQVRLAQKGKVLNKGAVDFSAITKMIDDMTAVLEAESADDEKHKVWCTGEFEASGSESEATSGKITSLAADIGETTDEVATLAEDITSLQEGIASLDKDVAVATEQRKAEHAEYLETVALTETAIQLIAKAKNRLQKFYNPALYKAPPKKELSEEDAILSKLSFVQVNRHTRSHVVLPAAPESFAQYQKKTEKSGGVMALMDMLSGELGTSMKDAEYAEKTAQSEYSELMADSQATRATDSKSATDKASAKAQLESKLVDLKEQKVITTEQLENINAYIAELHGSCDFILANFALRLEARTSEIEGLKNAKAVLAGASYSL